MFECLKMHLRDPDLNRPLPLPRDGVDASCRPFLSALASRRVPRQIRNLAPSARYQCPWGCSKDTN
jgi:hypothetical protein